MKWWRLSASVNSSAPHMPNRFKSNTHVLREGRPLYHSVFAVFVCILVLIGSNVKILLILASRSIFFKEWDV